MNDKLLADDPIPCESCGDDASEQTYEGVWLCVECRYWADYDSFESRSDRAYGNHQ